MALSRIGGAGYRRGVAMATEKRAVSARVDLDLADWLERYAAGEFRSVAYVLTRIIEDFRDRKEAEKEAPFAQREMGGGNGK